MFATAANFIIALIEERPVAAGNILRDAGGPKVLQLDVQGLQPRLESALERREVEARSDLANSILNDSLRTEASVVEGCDFVPLTSVLLAELNNNPACTTIHAAAIKIAEEAFELGRRSVEEIVEQHATFCAERLERMQKPKFMEVQVL